MSSKRSEQADNTNTDGAVKLHSPCSSHVLRKLRNLTETCDIVFLVNGERFPAHRAIIAAGSPVLERLMLNGMKESRQSEILIKEVDAVTWGMVLDYIYTVDVKVSGAERGMQILECAHRFQLEHLERATVDYLLLTIDEKTCCKVLALARRLQCETRVLHSLATKTISFNFHSICRSFEFGILDIDAMEVVVKDLKLKIQSELDVLRAIIGWILLNRNQLPVGHENTGHSLSSQISLDVSRLTKHIALDRMNRAEIHEAFQMCYEFQIKDLLVTCLNQLYGKHRNFERTTPIPRTKRILHTRMTPIFSFRHRFLNVSREYCSWGRGFIESPSVPDFLGLQQWKLRLCFPRRNERWVSLGLGGCSRRIAPLRFFVERSDIKYQFFIMSNSTNHVIFSTDSSNESNRPLGHFTSNNYNVTKRAIPLNLFQHLLEKESDAVTLGVTIYFTSWTTN